VYGGVTPERIERIVREHVIGGRIVGEWVVQRYHIQIQPTA
jgi:(2Fe-2S) ferredoxin